MRRLGLWRAGGCGNLPVGRIPRRLGGRMTDKKFWLGVIAAFIVTMLGGFAVHATWLNPDYLALPQIMRSEEDSMGYMHFMLLAHAILSVGLVWIFRQGRAQGDWVGQGLRFGLAIAVVSAVPYFMIYHAVAQFPLELSLKQMVGDTVTLLAAGLAVAFVHR